jgi:superfamily I DNA/RNA helicase
MKKIRIAGPPGTGKTTKLVEIYYSHLKEYSPADIVVISHTNTASDHIRERIKDSKSIQNYQKETGHEIFPKINNAKETLKHNVSTIHKFCKDRVEGQAFLIEDYENLLLRKPIFDKHTSGKKFSNVQALFGLHPFFKFISMARDNGKTVESYYRGLTAEEREKDVKYYLEEELEPMADYYKKFKESFKINGRVDNILDFQDMIKKFYDNEDGESEKLCSNIKVLMIDEAQDSSVIQRNAETIMSKNVDYFYKAGDPDQSIFEFAGADPHSFHIEFAKPEIELKKGYRCPRVINEYCKNIIKDIWIKYEYERVWTPKKEGGIVKEGELHYMSDLIRDPLSHKLKDTLLNTNQDFIFTYRGREPKEILNYLMGIGIPFQLPPKDNLKFKIKYPSKEIKNQREFKELMEGQQKTRAKIKSILNSMSDEYKLKTVEDLEKAEQSIFDITWLIDNKFFVPGIVNTNDFQRVSNKNVLFEKDYIRKIVDNNRDLEDKRVFVENIHTIKGKEFDNVVLDFTLSRQEESFTKKRMKFVACSRAKETLWLLNSRNGLTFAGKEDYD